MLTAAITSAIVAVLSAMGISPSVGLVAGIAIAVKIIIVATLSFFGWRTIQKERAAKKAAAAEIKPVD